MWLIDAFMSIFGNVLGILFLMIFLLSGIVSGLLIAVYRRPKNRVFYIRERDSRGEELKISREDSISLRTESDPPLRFFKWGKAYDFRGRFHRVFTTFFGKEGTAYSWRLRGHDKKPTEYEEKQFEMFDDNQNPILIEKRDEEDNILEDEDGNTIMIPKMETKKIPVKWETEKIEMSFETLEEAVKYRWGESFYRTVPENRKMQLQDLEMLVTVELEEGYTPEGFKPITEEQIYDKANERVAEIWSVKARSAIKQPVVQYIAWMGCGVAIGLALVYLGLMKPPASTPSASILVNTLRNLIA